MIRAVMKWVCGSLVVVFVCAPNTFASEPSAEGLDFFENEIRPLLVKRCYECHGDKDEPEAGLRLNSRAAILTGGESGPAIADAPDGESLLLEAINYRGLEMPPQGKLPAAEIEKLERWVKMGLPWPKEAEPTTTVPTTHPFVITEAQRNHWAFQPVQASAPPDVSDPSWVITPIDRYVLAKLESKNLRPNPAADKRTLLRRVTYDLTGLPSTPQETLEFLSDNSPHAFAIVVERLLGSPQYGERWGRHWLDVVRYADTAGDVADYPVPQAYRYRNYVIDAFNTDKPYDQFVREQLMGDVLAKNAPREKYAELITATGYIAVTRRFGYDRYRDQHLTISDTLDTLGKSMLGLSIGCARCHDHKFDPISAADYYALYGIFSSTVYPFPGAEEQKRPADFVPLIPPTEHTPLHAQLKAEIAKYEAELKVLEDQRVQLRDKVKATPDAPADLRAELDRITADRDAKKLQLDKAVCNPPYETAYAVADGKPQNASIHRRGDPTRLGPEIPRRFLEILGGEAVPADAQESGRRQLADWILDRSNPLTARVMVNRVWQHHFGKGLVQTPSDFGLRGKPPTHPELLDYLANAFIDNGWSIKTLHKQILLSNAYQMSSEDRADALSVDPNNDLLWRMNPQRLDAECIRDAMLAIGGQLDPSRADGHPFPPAESWVFNVHHPFKALYETNRRSIYLMTQRIQKHPFLGLFDGADPGATTDQRMITTTPSQALFMMNDPFVHEQSLNFARRVYAMAGDDAARLNAAYELAYSRPPTGGETHEALAFLEGYRAKLSGLNVPASDLPTHSLAAYLRTLLASNEFLFVD